MHYEQLKDLLAHCFVLALTFICTAHTSMLTNFQLTNLHSSQITYALKQYEFGAAKLKFDEFSLSTCNVLYKKSQDFVDWWRNLPH